MRIFSLLKGKITQGRSSKQPPHSRVSREEKLRELHLLMQSPFKEDREKAIAGLKGIPDSNHVNPAGTRSFTRRECMILVLDCSGSMASPDYPPSRLKAAIDASAELIRIRAGKDPGDKVAIVSFNSQSWILTGPVALSDGEKGLIRKLRNLQATNGTDIAAGLNNALGLLGNVEAGVQSRVVLLTDGHGGQPLSVANKLKKKGVVIDVIGIGGSPAEVNEKLLRDVASTIDGDNRYRFIADRDELFRHFRQLAEKLVK